MHGIIPCLIESKILLKIRKVWYVHNQIKRMKHRLSYLYFILPAIVVLYSCAQEEYCAESVESTMNIGFYSMHDEEMVDTSFYKFWARGYQQDSLINSDTTSISGVLLPLSNSEDSCTFIFSYTIILDTITTYIILDTLISLGTVPDSLSIIAKDSLILLSLPDTLTSSTQLITHNLKDTLRFYYTRQLLYLSPACGFMYNYNLHGVSFTHNCIDTVLITKPYISTLNEENVQILY